MPRTPRARTEKREQILEGAIAAFAAKGFHRTRVSDVAREAGVADGTIYLYFANKNELLSTIFATALDKFWERGEPYLREHDNPVEQMDRLVELHLRFMGEDRRLATVFEIDLRNSLPFLGEVNRNVLRTHFERVAAIVRTGQEQGHFDAELDPMVAAGMVFGVLDELTTAWVLSRRNYRLESQAPSAQRFVRRALGATGSLA